MSNGTTSNKKDGSLKNATWVDSAPKEGTEGHDYFVRGTKYTNSNVSAKYGGVMNSGVSSNTTTKQNVVNKNNTEFKGMLVESDIAAGRTPSTNTSNNKRIESTVNNANNTSSVINNYNPTGLVDPARHFNAEGSAGSTIERGVNDMNTVNKNNEAWRKENDENRKNRNASYDSLYEKNQKGKLNKWDQKLFDGMQEGKMAEQADKYYRENKREGGGITTGGYNVANSFSEDVTGVGLNDIAKEFFRFAPYTGDMIDATETAQDLAAGRFEDAAVGGVATAVPFVPAKYAKMGYKFMKQASRGAKNLGFGKLKGALDKINPTKQATNLMSNLSGSSSNLNFITDKTKQGLEAYKKEKRFENRVDQSSFNDEKKKIAVNNSGVVKPKS
jgi:hypothetical protein